MKVNLYTIYDCVAEECGPVYEAKNDDIAVRKIVQMFLDHYKGQLVEEDYHLYSIAEFDTESKELTPVQRVIDIKYPISREVQRRMDLMDKKVHKLDIVKEVVQSG